MRVTKTYCDRCGKECTDGERKATYDRELCEVCYEDFKKHTESIKTLEDNFWKQKK